MPEKPSVTVSGTVQKVLQFPSSATSCKELGPFSSSTVRTSNPPGQDWGETIPAHLCALIATDENAPHSFRGIGETRAIRLRFDVADAGGPRNGAPARSPQLALELVLRY
jgi:hypothetical protein